MEPLRHSCPRPLGERDMAGADSSDSSGVGCYFGLKSTYPDQIARRTRLISLLSLRHALRCCQHLARIASVARPVGRVRARILSCEDRDRAEDLIFNGTSMNLEPLRRSWAHEPARGIDLRRKHRQGEHGPPLRPASRDTPRGPDWDFRLMVRRCPWGHDPRQEAVRLMTGENRQDRKSVV